MDKEYLGLFEKYIHQHFIDVLRISPEESLTPFEIEHIGMERSEFIFIAKASPYLYEPLNGRDLSRKSDVKVIMYLEGDSLIVRFELLGDIVLESEIHPNGIHYFLSILFHQETITLAVVDSSNYKLIWLTNTIPFSTIRFAYKEIFEHFNIVTP